MITTLQENVLSLLCFSEKTSRLLVNVLEPSTFENDVLAHIASVAISYHRKYKKPVGIHLADLLVEKLKNPLYRDTLQDLHDISFTINEEFVLSQLNSFLRQQVLKNTIHQAVECLEHEDYNAVETLLAHARKQNVDIFQPGLCLQNYEKSLNFLDEKNIRYKSGIKELDMYSSSPAPKELFTIIGKSGGFKSWFLVYLGKYLLLQQKKVLHISLEMSEGQVAMRYIQALYSIPKKEAELKTGQLRFKKDRFGSVVDFEPQEVQRELSFEQPQAEKNIKRIMSKSRGLDKLYIKSFPSGQLSYKMFIAYLDQMMEVCGFIPDAILLDYADLMKIDRRNIRTELGALYVDLRGLAAERNLALITVSQANRSSYDTEVVTKEHFSEDSSKGFTSDVIVTLNMTASEKQHGLLRLFVDKSRNDRDGQTILISHNLALGQFCVDSGMLRRDTTRLYKKLEDDPPTKENRGTKRVRKRRGQ